MQESLAHVHEGMNVLDKAGHHIGTVNMVKMSDENPDTAAVEQVGLNPLEDRRSTLLETILEAFRIDEVPEEVHEQLMREGFVRIDADGLFASDRYITREQIAEVADGNLKLKVGKEQLIRSE